MSKKQTSVVMAKRFPSGREGWVVHRDGSSRTYMTTASSAMSINKGADKYKEVLKRLAKR